MNNGAATDDDEHVDKNLYSKWFGRNSETILI